MAFTEVYTALASGAVDGQDNPLPTVVDARFYEVTNQIALTSHLVDLNYLAMSAEVFNSLTPEQQEQIQAAADAAAAAGRERQLQLEDELVAFLREQGLDVYEPDLAAFRSAVQAAYLESDLSASWPEGVLERINELGN
jgi:TRAP-type C4-dicarboxylate transport system substrate-binding protein